MKTIKSGITWQVTRLDLSEKLRDLGLPQDSFFCWRLKHKKDPSEFDQFGLGCKGGMLDFHEGMSNVVASAFTLSELNYILENCHHDEVESETMEYLSDHHFDTWQEVTSMSVDNKAELIIYLIEKKIIEGV